MGQNGLYDGGRIVALDGNAHVGQGVSLAPRMVERGELPGIAGQRPVRSQRHAALDQLEGAIQPDGDAVVLEQSAVGRLGKCAAAIRRGLERDARTIVTPRACWILVALARLLPSVVQARMAGMNESA